MHVHDRDQHEEGPVRRVPRSVRGAGARFAAQHGMLWVGLNLFPGKSAAEQNRIGGWLGAMAQSDDASPEATPIASDLQTAAHLGQRVAETVRRRQPA